MPIREMASDPDAPAFLAPGFLAAIPGPGFVVFPQLMSQTVRRAARGAVQLVAELSRGDVRSPAAIIDEVVEDTGADPAQLGRFVAALRDAGLTLPAPPSVRLAPPAPEPTSSLPPPDGAVLALVKPFAVVVEAGAYLLFDHVGVLLARLSPAEVLAASAFAVPRTIAAAWSVHQKARPALTDEAFRRLVERLHGTGHLRASDTVERPAAARTASRDPREIVLERVAATAEQHQQGEARRPGRRTPVVPVNAQHGVAPLSIALLVAYAAEHDGSRLTDRYDFVPEYLTDQEHLVERATEPSVFLFSNYVWNVDQNLALSALAKRANPSSVMIHGGPSTPKYPGDVDEFFAQHEHVDVAVHGEGEVTFAEALSVIDGVLPATLDALAPVAGLSYRSVDGSVVRTGDRERITDLDEIPSPYLLGYLDAFGAAQAGAIIETNRGCPYGCTFCDWGSATLSRIRKFSLDRVFAELEWSARNMIDVASIADANFGIMERDVEIAQQIADLKRRYGFPRTVATNYAKNTVKHLRKIIEIFADVDILTEGVVSLQSMDEPTLKIVRRSNIKLEKYNELSTEFRRSRLPLAADIMMGLPGATPHAFRNDLQQCTNRDVRVRANPTQLLPNSPMNDPEYRSEHGIVAKPGETLMETSSYTRAEWDDMNGLRRAYYIFDNWGVLRYVSRFVRQETGVHEVAFHDRIRKDAVADRRRWPVVATVLEMLESYMAPPGSWALFVDEVGRYLVSVLDIPDAGPLRTTLAVQLAHLPAPGRRFPLTLELEHDFVAWQDELLAARENGHRDDWELVVPRLADYPRGELTISDPNDICATDVGKPMGVLGFSLRSWELDSPAARPRLGLTAPSGV